MRSTTLLSSTATIAMMASLTTAQTPPGYTPATSAFLSLSFANQTVTPGTKLPLTSVLTAPTTPSPLNNSLIIMLDLDAPFGASNRSFSPLCHWIATGSSDPVSYAPPQPPAGSPDHRYVLLAYELPANQPGAFEMPEGFQNVNASVEGRVLFDLSGFVGKAGLKGPVAANWILVGPAGGNGTGGASANGTAPEQFESGAAKGVGRAVVGSVVFAGVVALMTL